MAETVLVVGASGKTGVGAVVGTLRSGRKVLAVVRNKAGAEKLEQHVGSLEGITIVEADFTTEDGMRGVVDKVKQGKLPTFQHVFSGVGGIRGPANMPGTDLATYRSNFNVNFEANFFAYHATAHYLWEQDNETTWTVMSGGSGELGWGGVTCISQGAIFSLANAASFENNKKNLRFNEIYLRWFVDFDSAKDAGQTHPDAVKSSDFGRVYEKILNDKDIKGCRVSILGPEDIDKPKVAPKLPEFSFSFPDAVSTTA